MSPAEQFQQMENRIGQLEKENQRLQETVQFLTRKLYGRSTEKTTALPVGVEQLSLFDEAETETSRSAPEPDLKQVASYQRKRNIGDRVELLKDIPHEKMLCALTEQERCCAACQHTLVRVGEEWVRTEIEFIPATVRAIAASLKLPIWSKQRPRNR